MSDCTITHIETHSQQLDACPLCGHEAALWELVDEHGVFKFACCGRSADGSLGLADGCPLCFPPRNHFYLPTLREAARRWNEFGAAARKARIDSILSRDGAATPGPWEVIDGFEVSAGMSWIQVAAEGRPIEVCIVRYVAHDGCGERAKANARLIAAAPRLKTRCAPRRERLSLCWPN